MSYQDYQYSFPSDSYDYSYSTTQSAQHTTATNSQGQYTPSNQFSTSSTQGYQYEKPSSFPKPQQTGQGSIEYSSMYTSNVTSAAGADTMDVQYGQDQFSQYSAPHDSSSYPSSLSYQYSNSQATPDPSTATEVAYGNDTSSYSSTYSSSYQYSKPAAPQVEPQAPTHSYGGGMGLGYTPVGDSSQDTFQPGSYTDDYSRSSQYLDTGTPTDSYASQAYYSGNDDQSVGGGGNFPSRDNAMGVNASSGFPGSFSNSISGEPTSNYAQFDDGNSSSSYSLSTYDSQGQGGYSGYGHDSYSQPAEERRGGYSAHSRGGRMNRSTFSSNRGGGSSNSYSNSFNQSSHGNENFSKESSRGGQANQFGANRYNSSSSRSRGSNGYSSNNPRSRGSSAGLSRGSASTHFNRGGADFNRGDSNFSRGASNFNRGSSGGSRFNSSRGNSSFHNRGSNPSVLRGGQQRGSFTKFSKDSNSTTTKDRKPLLPQDSTPSRNVTRQPDSGSLKPLWKSAENVTSEKKEKLKAPSRPQDKLLNEIEEKERKEKEEKERKAAQEKEKAVMARKSAEDARKAEEEAQKKIMEEARQKAEEMAKKTAPPSKPPETPEEIAKEEEIQRKIRESVVVVDPAKEMSLLTDDPTKEIEMPEDLRKILKTLTTDTLCKLCSLRMIGPFMAPMHYNGKNHLKKVRTFVQTNGRSAGFNMETSDETEEKDSEKKEGDSTEKEEEMEVDEKKYCKICKVSFPPGSQYEMHYKGKNHAKRVRSLANSAEVFECKLCCVTVTAQDHLTAHLNGARHKLQMRKNNRVDSMQSRGGLYGRGGRGGLSQSENGFWKASENSEGKPGFQGRGRFDGRGRGRGRGGDKSLIHEAEEELYNLLGMTPEKRFRFDIANFQTPSGSFYCSHCDLTVEEEAFFLQHLGNKKHLNKVYSSDRSNRKGRKISANKLSHPKKDTISIPTNIDITVGRSH